jgi:hypothetical protein
MHKIAIAGNTSLAYYCAQKLCRSGAPVDIIFYPKKGNADLYDAVDFSPLAGEFRICRGGYLFQKTKWIFRKLIS